MNLRLGMRVKKVRGGFNLGTTGVVWMLINSDPYNIVIRTDQDVMGVDGAMNPAGSLLASFAEDWEPEVGDMSFRELMQSLNRDKETVQ